jgi:hypothetical protein
MIAAAAVSVAMASAASASEVIYNNIPSPFPTSTPSVGFEANQIAEFGGAVKFGETARKNPSVSVVMVSFACETGTWNNFNCKTFGGKFEEPITISVYDLGPGNTIGPKIAAGSKTFKIPYRPSANTTKCTGAVTGDFFAKGECFGSKAVKITLPLKVAKLPEEAIVTVAYNTSDYGAKPQRPQPCNSEPQGCPYDALNVGVEDGFTTPAGTPPNPGSFPLPTEAFVNGAFEGGWEGFQPEFSVKASS